MWFFPFHSVYLFFFCPYSLLPLSQTSIYLYICIFCPCLFIFFPFPSLFHSFFLSPLWRCSRGPLRVELSALINRVPMVILAISPKTNNRRMFICAPSTDPDPCSQSEAPPCLLPQHCLCSSAQAQLYYYKHVPNYHITLRFMCRT